MMFGLVLNGHAQEPEQLVVAWYDNNTIMVWRTGDAAPTPHTIPETITGTISQILISSDGQYAAVKVNDPGSLWLAAPTNPDLVEAVPNEALLTTDDPKYIRIGNLQRGTHNTFYFNTANAASQYTVQNNDLWSVDAASLTFKLLVPPQEAGVFSLSPDQQHTAIVQAGTYGAVDGKIMLANQDGENRQEIMTFSAISSGSDNDFYPSVYWQADSSAFNVAIPHQDLIYNDDTAPTTLWHIAVDGTKTQQGRVQASIFGLPRWSDDGKYLTYLRHQGDISTNQFEMMVAAGDGSNAVVYAAGTAGYFGVPQWISNSDQFIYAQGEPGEYWLGQAGQPPQALPGKIFNPIFVDSTSYVFSTETGELRYAHVGDTTSTLIAATSNPNTLFDALNVPYVQAETNG